jgi:DNA-binding NarL/FixJ family response regulator
MKNAGANAVSVFVVEDSDEIRRRLVGLLEDSGDISVVGEATNSAAAIDGILNTRPRAVVLDLHLAPGSGVEVLRETHPKVPDTMFIVLTGHPDEAYKKVCLKLGATHFLDKTKEFANVVPLIRALAPTEGRA